MSVAHRDHEPRTPIYAKAPVILFTRLVRLLHGHVVILSQCSDDHTLVSGSGAKSRGLVTLRPLVNLLSSLSYN